MKDIRIYDFEFNLLCIMTDVISSEWHLQYNAVGSYEGHFRLRDRISGVILSHKYIVIVQGDLQAVCTGKIVSDEELTVCGRTVNWILTRRIMPPFKARLIFGEEYTDPETVLLYCLKKAFIEPPRINSSGLEMTGTIDDNKKITNFILPEPIGAEAFTYHFWRLKANTLSDLTIALCKRMNRGHRVVFDIDNKCWRFEFIYPQKNNIYLSKEIKSVYDVSYTEDILKEADGGWYPGSNDDSEQDDNAWYYIKNGDKTGIYAWDCVLDCTGQSEAQDELSKRSISESTKAKLRELKFGTDYSLGDIVAVHVKMGGFEKETSCMVNGADIKMTHEYSYEEPDLQSTAIQ